MAAFPLTTHQLRFEVERVRRKDRENEYESLVIGFHATGPWRGESEVNLDGRRYAVVRADSALEFREALAVAEADDRPTVVLTALDQAELGHDVVARLARSKLWPVDPWEGVKGLFRARQLDPALREACLAQALLEHQPPGRGYDPVPAGVLDAGTAWRAIYRHALGMEDREPDLPGLLRWAAETGAGGYLDVTGRPPRGHPGSTGGDARGGGGRHPRRRRVRDRPRRPGPGPGLRGGLLGARCRRTRAPGRRGPPGAIPSPPADRARHRPDPGPCRPGRDRRPRPRRPCQGPGPPAPRRQPAPRRRGRPAGPSRQPNAPGLGSQATPVRNDVGREGRGRRPGRLRGRIPARRQSMLSPRRTPIGHDWSGRGWPCGWPAGSGRRKTCEGSFAQLARRYAEEVAFVDWARDSLAGGDDLPELGDAFGRIGQAAADRRRRLQPGLRRGPGRLDRQRLGPRGRPPRRGRRGPGGRRRCWSRSRPSC